MTTSKPPAYEALSPELRDALEALEKSAAAWRALDGRSVPVARSIADVLEALFLAGQEGQRDDLDVPRDWARSYVRAHRKPQGPGPAAMKAFTDWVEAQVPDGGPHRMEPEALVERAADWLDNHGKDLGFPPHRHGHLKAMTDLVTQLMVRRPWRLDEQEAAVQSIARALLRGWGVEIEEHPEVPNES